MQLKKRGYMYARFFYPNPDWQKEMINLRRSEVLDWNIRHFNPDQSPAFKKLRERLAAEKTRSAFAAAQKTQTDEERAEIPSATVQVAEELELMAEIIVYKSEQGECFAPMKYKG